MKLWGNIEIPSALVYAPKRYENMLPRISSVGSSRRCFLLRGGSVSSMKSSLLSWKYQLVLLCWTSRTSRPFSLSPSSSLLATRRALAIARIPSVLKQQQQQHSVRKADQTSYRFMSQSTVETAAMEDESDEGSVSPLPKKRRGRPKKAKATDGETSPKKKRGRPKKAVASSTSKKAKPVKGSDSDDNEEKENSTPTKKTKKSTKRKAPDHQRQTERDATPRLWHPEGEKHSYTLRVASWNVAGLRAVMRNHPEALSNLVTRHDIDVLCLQETKLQESHLDDPKLKIRGHLLEQEGYDAYYSCSVARKGYAGTAVFVRRRGSTKKQSTMDSFLGKKNKPATKESTPPPIDAKYLMPERVTYKIGKPEHDQEGRVITLDFPLFSMTNVYVPNSGQKLDRLSYRTEQWDKEFLAFMQSKQDKPVFWVGDLNVAHTGMDVWNEGAKHLPKQAGVTPQERASFQQQLDAGFVDVFRRLHPEAKGCYSYWSQRAGNREPNKGLRLDYFICSPNLLDANEAVVVRDSYMLYDVVGSDHCPVVLELEIKEKKA